MNEDRDAMRTGSRSFHLASRLLPAPVREPARALYAFCRSADDEIDRGVAPAALHRRLDAIYAGAAAGADGRLGRVVQSAAIGRDLLEQLLEGFVWDVEGRRYDDLPGLRAYALRVAGSAAADAPYEIAAVLPLSGSGAVLGAEQRDALATIEASVNDDGGISGRPIHFAIADDESNARTAGQLTDV